MSFALLPSKAGIYSGWTGRGNLGDEAMLEVCREVFDTVHWSSYESVSSPTLTSARSSPPRRKPLRWINALGDEMQAARRTRAAYAKVVHQIARRSGGEVALFGGGTLLNDRGMLAEYLDLRERTGRPVPVFGSGVSDPIFWNGAPGWRDERNEWVDALRELPVVGVRGPRSRQLLDECGAKNVVISGDPAVALHRPLTSPCPHPKKLTIAINCALTRRAWGGFDALSFDTLNNELAEAARRLAEAGNRVEIVPVMPGDVAECYRVAAKAGVRATRTLSCASDYLSLMRGVDVVIATRLHAAVLSAAANVPFIMIEYQPKCMDFTSSIGWEGFTYRSDQANAASLCEAVAAIAEDLPRLRSELCESMCKMKRCFLDYCESIRPLLIG